MTAEELYKDLGKAIADGKGSYEVLYRIGNGVFADYRYTHYIEVDDGTETIDITAYSQD